ncbi:MAG TPA: TraB/GumN family protein [Candidatus Binatia bacterium]|nr:TraB/GumN family protein [Candidatus Binatia bacterium]
MDLVIVGTSHIAKESVREVTHRIEKEAPDIIALELDKGRLHALLHPKQQKSRMRDIRHVGLKGWMFAQLGSWAEKKLGRHVGVSPGQDMLTAFRIAREQKIPIALVDQDITITLKRFSQTLTWRERARFVIDIVSGVLKRKDFGFDLRTVPSEKVIAQLIGRVRKHYPNVYKVLVVERNDVMARNLAMLMKLNPGKKILAVVGAGHERELEALVQKYLTKTI